MKTLHTFSVALIAMAIAGNAAGKDAAQVLVTEASTKGAKRTYAVDFYSDGTAVGFQVDLSVPGLKKKDLDLSKCQNLSLGDSATTGGCSFTEGVVRFVGVNTDLRALPQGWHNLGTFGVANLPKGGVVKTKILATNAEGRAVDIGFEFAAEK